MVERLPILEHALLQTLVWLRETFKEYNSDTTTTLSVHQVTGPSQLRQLTPVLRQGEREIKLSYPYLLYTIGDFSINTEQGGNNKAQLKDVLMAKDVNSGVATLGDLRRVKVGIGISFCTSDFKQLVSFMEMILDNAPSQSFYMQSEDFVVGSKLNISESLSVPPINTETPGEAYQFEATLTLDTFIGKSRTQKLIREIVFRIGHENNRPFYNDDPTKDMQELVYNRIRFTDYFDKSSDRYKDRT
mgnify:CR=1 FL=1